MALSVQLPFFVLVTTSTRVIVLSTCLLHGDVASLTHPNVYVSLSLYFVTFSGGLPCTPMSKLILFLFCLQSYLLSGGLPYTLITVKKPGLFSYCLDFISGGLPSTATPSAVWTLGVFSTGSGLDICEVCLHSDVQVALSSCSSCPAMDLVTYALHPIHCKHLHTILCSGGLGLRRIPSTSNLVNISVSLSAWT